MTFDFAKALKTSIGCLAVVKKFDGAESWDCYCGDPVVLGTERCEEHLAQSGPVIGSAEQGGR